MLKTIPKKIGKFDIGRVLGSGSTGTVYLAEDPFIGRQVAVKVAVNDLMADPKEGARYRKMFFNEAKIAGILNHPNILPTFDAGIDGKLCYIVMEYMDSEKTLADFCTPETLLPVEKVIEIIYKCCKALAYAHRFNIIHRDIKPSNILLTKEMDVKIADFSLAQYIQSDSTQLMGIVGSPRYMSPEQLNEEVLTIRTDLFSLGVVLYEMLAGCPPFQAENVTSLIYQIAYEDPPPLRYYQPEMPEMLELIIRKALNKNPEGRYQNGEDFASDLSQALSQKFNIDQDPSTEINQKQRFNHLKKLNFFKEFTDLEIWEVIRASVWVEFHQGQIIVHEGDVSDSFYVIISGKVDVTKEDITIVTLNEGDCFGEMGYLTHTIRSADVVTNTNVMLIKVNSTLIERSSPNCQLHFYKVFLKTLINRLKKTSNMISKHEGSALKLPQRDSSL
ncbi:MAG: protein kinase [Nitrospirae bacterium]|nr:protein kinase [Nitrospirota bacterium]